MGILFANKFEVNHKWFELFKIEVISVRVDKENIIITISHNRRKLLSIIEAFKNSDEREPIRLVVGEDVILINPNLEYYTFGLKNDDQTHVPLHISLYFSNKINFEN